MDRTRLAEPVWKDRLEAWWSSRTHDMLYALGMTAVLVYGAYGEAHPAQPGRYFSGSHHVPHTPSAAYLLVAAACLVLAFRRRRPALVLTVSTVAAAVYSLLGYVNGAAVIAPMAALYALAVRVSVRRALIWGAGMLAVLIAATIPANPFGPFGGGFIVMPFAAAVACFAGIAVASRRAYVASIKARSEADAQRRIDEERLRIARELHDIVAHTMATINVQAGTAAHVAADRPDAAVAALQAIKAASKDGLRELRAILNVLRQSDGGEENQPAPGLGQLDALLASTRAAGLAVTLTVTGAPRPLGPAADLAAYRIVQESLTNVIRHAGPAAAAVSLRYGDRELVIEVSDNGRGPAGQAGRPAEGHGHGLTGMRERAAAAGGSLQAGPASSGFLVTARLPLNGPRQPVRAPLPAAAAPVPDAPVPAEPAPERAAS